jgi:chemotaxis protein histidine kinase CheA
MAAATTTASLSDRAGNSRIVADQLEGSLKHRASNRYCSVDRLLFSAALLSALTITCAASSAFANTITQSTDDDSATAAKSSNVVDAANATSSRPKPDRDRKVYTNDDVAAVARNGATSVGNAFPAPDNANAPAAGTVLVPGQRIPIPQPRVVMPLAPEKDPVFYAQQYVALSARIADIDNQIERLRNFRASDVAPGSSAPGFTVGLNIYAPTDGGISTDAQIQQLQSQRAAIQSQMSDLEDRARTNGIAPEVLRDATQIAERAENIAPLNPRQQLIATREQLDQLQSDLTEVRDTETAMHQQAAAQKITLYPENKYGGGFTADYLKQLSKAQSEIQQQINNVQDTARQDGIPPGDLPR